MRPCPGNQVERVAGEVPASMVLLVAMLENQIDSLARMHVRGLWVDSPQEIGARLVMSGLDSRDFAAREALEEWHLWTGATDALLRVLEDHTLIRIDRGRIVSLAKKRGAVIAKDGRVMRKERRG